VFAIMKYLIIFALLAGSSLPAIAGQDTLKQGTITVKKKGKKKTLFDQVNDRLILVDPKGAVIDSGEVTFDMVIEKDGKMTTLSAHSNYLTPEMQNFMQVAQDGTIFYFKNIKLKNNKGEIESYPSTVVKVDAEFYRKRKSKEEEKHD
jgi:3-keto-L-gulonate-6-phosphate decarboxylase